MKLEKRDLRRICRASTVLKSRSNASEASTVELNAAAQIILATLSGLGLLLKGVAAVVTALRQPPSPR
ncbi:MAG TPA: hypothetical protein VEW26_07985 [Allosphingosinicella sp.]|nr:hypothetical protein [Allosphingosinicella sp.]